MCAFSAIPAQWSVFSAARSPPPAPKPHLRATPRAATVRKSWPPHSPEPAAGKRTRRAGCASPKSTAHSACRRASGSQHACAPAEAEPTRRTRAGRQTRLARAPARQRFRPWPGRLVLAQSQARRRPARRDRDRPAHRRCRRARDHRAGRRPAQAHEGARVRRCPAPCSRRCAPT